MMERSPLQYLSKTFTCSLKVTLPNIRKGLVKVTFPSHLQYLNGSLSKSLRSLKVYFRAVLVVRAHPGTVTAVLSTVNVYAAVKLPGRSKVIHLRLVDPVPVLV